MQTGLRGFVDGVVGPLGLLIPAPLLCLVFAWLTCCPEMDGQRTLGGLLEYGRANGLGGVLRAALGFCGTGDAAAWRFLGAFNLGALALYYLPGPTKYGPATPTGHVPDYTDNGLTHCLLFTALFVGGSNVGPGELYDLGVIFDTFAPTVGALNVFGLVFRALLYVKGLAAPSGAGVAPDCGRSGYGPIFDYYWGTELYPRIGGVDVKKFVNCRFAMTYWQLAGVSFAYRSYTLHGAVDPAIVLCALSQYLYLVKFFVWEIGYMRSIDIIVDRAGFYETWGCLVWVPSVYTFHTRLLVTSTSGLSWPAALLIFGVGLAGVGLNFWADNQRQVFREMDGKCTIWGAKPVFIKASYTMVDAKTGKVRSFARLAVGPPCLCVATLAEGPACWRQAVRKQSLLLASGWWGVARHFQYAFELTAAWSWGLLAMGHTNGLLPLFYPAFLTILLVHRALRDEEKCLAKYGADYEK